jgi:hypothetical protein
MKIGAGVTNWDFLCDHHTIIRANKQMQVGNEMLTVQKGGER